MICTVCNTKNNYFHNYCYHCGALLNQSELQQSSDGQPRYVNDLLLNKHRETFNPYKERKKAKKTLQYSMVISMIILAGMVYWFMMK